MQIKLEKCTVRSWRASDAESIAKHANNRNIWRNLRDGFPHPYSIDDAHRFIGMAMAKEPETFFCIVVGGFAVGGIGYTLNPDVERLSAEIGYWLGEEFWGRGIVTEALAALTHYAVKAHGLTCVYATPYGWNAASCKVLEKAGYYLVGRLRNSVIKDGQIIDKLIYAFSV